MAFPKINTRYLTGGATIAAAAVTAHLMQRDTPPVDQTAPVTAAIAATAPDISGSKPNPNQVTIVAKLPSEQIPAEPLAQEDTQDVAALGLDEPIVDAFKSTAEEITELPTPPRDLLMPAPLPQAANNLPQRVSDTINESSERAPGDEDVVRNEFGLPCGPILSASAKESGIAHLTLTAPCRGERRVEITHAGVVFSGLTDHLGNFQTDVPVLTTEADFTAKFEDGEEATSFIDLPEVAEIERVALMFDAEAGLQIHALEFGAQYGEDGHVWAGAPRDAALAAKLGGGYVTLLGDATMSEPQLAEVYTFPANNSDQSGVVRLSVEAEVNSFNCDKDVIGNTIEPGPDGMPVVMSLSVAMPSCDSIGEFLVLKNLLKDLRIAAN